MWKSFEGALEKRVRRGKDRKLDKYAIEKIVRSVLKKNFGLLGLENLEIISLEGFILKIRSNKSIWASEVRLKESQILEEINKEAGQRKFSNIIIVK